SFAAHVAEAAAPADDDADAVPADAVVAEAVAAESEPVAVVVPEVVESAPAAEPVIAAAVDVPAPAIVEAVAAEAAPAPVAATPAKRQPPARPRQQIAASKTDLADSLYIPPALEKAVRSEPPVRAEAPVRAEVAAPPPAPPVEVMAPAPQPVQAKAEPVIEAREAAVLPREEDRTIAAPSLESVALVPSTPAAVSLATVEVDGPGATLIPISTRRRSGLATMGQSTGNRRALLAAGIAVAVLVSGGLIAKTVLAGSSAEPGAQPLAAAGMTATPTGTAQPQQAVVDPAAQAAAIDTPASAADAALTPEEQARKAEEQKKLEEQRRLQQRQRDSLRQAQQLAAQQQPAAPQVALAAPRPVASQATPQLEQRPAAPAASEPAAPPPTAAARPAVDPSRVYGGGEVDQAPSLSNGPAFRSAVNRTYPASLRNTGRWGNALVSFTVGADGRVERSSISVEQASHPAFRAAATAAIASARFTPARVNGQPVRAQVSMPITWQGGGERDDD
ncbi:MAG TPA: TonB family protein, partial [Longimicrobium sp.]|nr:TonB family protein [Longimicrobium sp.]